MKRTGWILLIAAVLIGAGAAAWYRYGREAPAPEQTVETAPAPAPAAPPAPPVAAEPAIRNPLPEPPKDEPAIAADGDQTAALRELLAAVIGSDALARLVPPDDIARRFVATIDNLPREAVPTQIRALNATPGRFEVDEIDGTLSIARSNAARYALLMRTVESLDTAKATAAYLRAYPALQAQYRSLGYPDRYFNDRVVEAIDDLLAAPEPADPPKLLQPKVLYQYADSDWQAMSAGRKAMVRIGPANEARLKAKLRALRGAIARTPPPR